MTQRIAVDTTAYVQIAASGDDFIIENAGGDNLRIVFSASLPAVGTDAYHTLDSYAKIDKSVAGMNVYARADTIPTAAIVSIGV